MQRKSLMARFSTGKKLVKLRKYKQGSAKNSVTSDIWFISNFTVISGTLRSKRKNMGIVCRDGVSLLPALLVWVREKMYHLEGQRNGLAVPEKSQTSGTRRILARVSFKNPKPRNPSPPASSSFFIAFRSGWAAAKMEGCARGKKDVTFGFYLFSLCCFLSLRKSDRGLGQNHPSAPVAKNRLNIAV